MAREVRVTGDLPARQVDGLEARADLLHGHVASEGAQRVDVGAVALGHAVPQDPRRGGPGVILDDVALELGNLLGGVVAGDALPAGLVSQSFWISAAVRAFRRCSLVHLLSLTHEKAVTIAKNPRPLGGA